VGVTSEDRAPTEKFLEDTGWKAVVVIEKGGGTMKQYGFTGYPSSALVDPTGEVVWTGHPAGLKGSTIEPHLKGVRIRRRSADTLTLEVELPQKYAAVARKLAQGKLGPGYRDLQRAEERAEGEQLSALTAAIEKVDTLAEAELKAADSAVEEGRQYDAQETWKRLTKVLKGHPSEDTAAEKLKAQKADRALREEIEAGERIAKALALIEADQVSRGRRTLESVVSGRLEETVEARRAAKILAELDQE
jgi:hypothetical protein